MCYIDGMALTFEQEAALDGAWALRYCADKLEALNGAGDLSVKNRVWWMRDRATTLDGLAQVELPKIEAGV